MLAISKTKIKALQLPALLLFGFILRAIAGLYLQHHQLPDFFAQYGPIAEAFVKGRGFEDSRPPGFFIFLIPIVYLFKTNYIYPAILAQSIIGTIFIYVLYQLTLTIFKNNSAALIAASIATVYPWLIYYSGQLSPEHWNSFWIALSILLLVRHSPKSTWQSSLLVGLALGFTAWIRSTFLLYILLALPMAVITRKTNLKQLCIMFCGIAIFIGSWSGYNGIVNKTWSFSGGNADHNLYLGLNPLNKTGGATWGEDAPSLDQMHQILNSLPPEKAKTYYRDESLRFVKEKPLAVLKLAAQKMFIFWRPYPRAPEYTNILTILLIAGTFIPLVLGSLLSIILYSKQKNFSDILFILLYILQLNAIHLVFPGSLVYRYPIEPLLIVLASYTFSKLFISQNK